MSRRALLGLLCASVAIGLVIFAVKRNKNREPMPITPGKDTTVITGPLDAAGLIDYETALNERLKGGSSAETNAVVLLIQAIGPKPEGQALVPDVYKWLGSSPPPEVGDYVRRANEYFGEEIRGPDSQAFYDHENGLRERPWTAAAEPKHYQWLTANEKPLAVVLRASRRKDYFYPLVARTKGGERSVMFNVLLPLPQRCRELASILSLRVMLRCGEKKFEAAWEDVMTLHRLARLLARGGTLIERLVGVAIEHIARNSALCFLEAAKPTASVALACGEQLATLRPFPEIADTINTAERYLFLDGMQFLHRDPQDFKSFLDPRAFKDTPAEVIPEALARLNWDATLRFGNRWYDRARDALRKPIRAERRAALDAINKDIVNVANFDSTQLVDGSTGDPFADRLTTLFVPSIVRVADHDDRIVVQFRTELLAFSLAAYHADHKTYPAKLADLVPKYAKSIPDDVYSGKPLFYKPTMKGYELYSVGPNSVDDGGQSLDDNPRGDDYGVRMPNVKRAPKPDDDEKE